MNIQLKYDLIRTGEKLSPSYAIYDTTVEHLMHGPAKIAATVYTVERDSGKADDYGNNWRDGRAESLARLICAAPDLLNALESIADPDNPAHAAAIVALKKAKGKS